MDIQLNGIDYDLEVVIKTDNTGNNIQFVWTLIDTDNVLFNNGIMDGIEGVDECEYVYNALSIS